MGAAWGVCGLAMGLGLFSAACGDPVREAFLQIPDAPGMKTAIVALEPGNREPAIQVEDLGRPPRVGLSLTREAGQPPAVVSVWWFREEPGSLELEVGSLEAAAPGEPSRALPDPELVRSVELGDELPLELVAEDEAFRSYRVLDEAWRNGAGRDPSLLAGLRPALRCARFSSRSISTHALAESWFVVPFDERSVLIGTKDDLLLHVDREGGLEQFPWPGAPAPPAPFSGALRLENGDLIFGGASGGMWRWAATSTAFQPLPRPQTEETMRWMAASSDGSGSLLDLVVLSSGGTVWRLAEDRWTQLGSFGPPPPGNSFRAGAVVKTGPSQYVVAASQSDRILFFADGEKVGEDRDPYGQGTTSMAYQPSLGLIRGSGEPGSLAIKPDGSNEWLLLGVRENSSRVEALLPFEDGFLYGGIKGFIGQYRGGFGAFCTSEQLASAAPHDLAAVGDTIFCSGALGGNATLPVTLLTRRP